MQNYSFAYMNGNINVKQKDIMFSPGNNYLFCYLRTKAIEGCFY